MGDGPPSSPDSSIGAGPVIGPVRVWRYARNNPLGRRVLWWIVACSTILATLSTGVQLAVDYQADRQQVQQRFAEIEQAYLDSIAVAVWNIDETQMRAQLNGIRRLPDIVHARLVDARGRTLDEVGEVPDEAPTERHRFEFSYRKQAREPLGTLEVTASLAGAYERLGNRALVIFAAQGTKTFMVSLIILMIFRYFVSRPLADLARSARRIDLARLDEPITLQRPRGAQRDDFDDLVNALNAMRSSLQREVGELGRYRAELETRVVQRTAELGVKVQELQREREAQAQLIRQLEEAHNQVLQSEKLASIGQLAAGVAHEINNPIGFVNCNLGTLERHVDGLLRLIDAHERAAEAPGDSAARAAVAQLERELELNYLRDDVRDLMRESRDGLDRVKRIVQDLKDFSRVGETDWQAADLHACLDSTLNVVWNEIKYRAEVVKHFGHLPEVECMPSQLNQVFMNLLVNAAQAIQGRGTITICTGADEAAGEVWVSIADTGGGIAPEHLHRIFDPFFTTKPVGQGTGLGLSVSYSIVQKHGGRIEVDSRVGEGTCFRLRLPMRQARADTVPGEAACA